MTTRSFSVFREAYALLTSRLLAMQAGVALGVCALSIGWLRLPDASIFQVALSALFAIFIVASAGMMESWILMRLAGRSCTPILLLRGTILLVTGALVWLAWNAFIAHLGSRDSLWAGYFNSRASHRSRQFFSFEHILLAMQWMWSTLLWIGTGLIAIFVFTTTASRRPMHAASLAIRSVSFWLSLIAGAATVTLFVDSILAWTPFEGFWPETLSLLFRIAISLATCTAFVCWLLALLAVSVRRADSSYGSPAGGPEESHPRTADPP